jgi:GrpB-like predicted nucleotidyltransferase (UPF0157 family)
VNLSRLTVIKTNTDISPELHEHQNRLAHIHILIYNSEHWIRHIVFRDYLRTHPLIRYQYQQLKQDLSHKEWKDGNEYNQAKNEFIKVEEQNAVIWYN